MKNVYDGIIGLAIGDALGVPVEFQSRKNLIEAPVYSMREYGTHHQPVGTWSDDTSLTLALVDSIIETKEINYTDIMNKFTNWLLYQDYTATGEVFDVGNSTSRAIINYGRGIEPIECGGITENENGNGSLMRILPLAYYLHSQPDLTIECQMDTIHKVSSLTHRHPISLIGCGLYIMIAQNLLVGTTSLYESIEQGVKEAFAYYDQKNYPEVQAYMRLRNLYNFSQLSSTEIKSSGYVVDTLEAALWCLLTTTSYRECVLQAVNLGEDTDTVGAVCGGLAAIYYGVSAIPKEWLDCIARRSYIEGLCECLQNTLV